MNVTKKTPAPRDRAKYRCPKKVGELIDLANSIPPDEHLPHQREIFETASNDSKKILATMREKLKGVPQSFISRHGAVQGAYVQFRNIRRALRDLANLALVPLKDRRFYLSFEHHLPAPGHEKRSSEFAMRFKGVGLRDWKEHTTYDIDSQFGMPHFPSYQVSLRIGDDGKVVAETNSLIESLIGVSADRIRICQICDKIFWARQNNMVTCGTRCSNTYRQRKLRRERYRKSTNKTNAASKKARK